MAVYRFHIWKRRFGFRKPQGGAGFALPEILVTMVLCITAMACFYAAAGQAIQIVRAGKEITAANQLMQQRLESFRTAKLWANVSTPTGLKTLVATAQPAASKLSVVSESYTVSAHPAGTPSFTVTRSANGTVSTTGAALSSSQKCARVRAQVVWNGVKGSQTRSLVALISKGGI